MSSEAHPAGSGGRDSERPPELARGLAEARRIAADPVRLLLANRDLTRLVAGFSGVTVAEWGYVTAMAIYAYRLNGTVAVGLVGLRLFFAALGSLLTAQFVERHAGGMLLTSIAAARAVIMGASAILAASGSALAPLLVLVIVDALVSSPYRPAQSVLVPVLARTPTEVTASVAGLSTVKTLSQALGAVAGGSLLLVTTPAVVFSAAATLCLCSAALTIRFRGVRVAVTNSQFSGGFRKTARATLAVFRERQLEGILVASGLRSFVRGMWVAIAVVVSLQLLHAGSAGVGLLMLAWGIGSLTAVPLSGTFINRPRLGTPAAAALVACGVPLAVLAGIPLLGVALVLVAAWGVGMAVSDVTMVALLYRLLDTPLLPRVTGAIESCKLALEGLGAFLAPLLAYELGVRGALLLAALPLPIMVAAGWNVLHRVDAAAGERHRLLRLLHGVPCLAPLDLPALESLASRLTPRAEPARSEVVCQGDPGDHFYIVEAGSADVLVDGFLVGRIGPGGSFGEKALLRDTGRTATVRSREPMRLLALSREAFLTAVTGYEEGMASLTGARQIGEVPEPSPRDRAKLLGRVGLFSHLDSSALKGLADRSVVDQWPAGSTIIRRGDEGDRFYVLLEGRAAVSVGDRFLGELLPGDHFGEIALLHDVPRTATVQASTPVATLSLDRSDLPQSVRARVLLG
jgi:CRP-like cAMP-binding protein